jgi:hyperosmotically inducible protein
MKHRLIAFSVMVLSSQCFATTDADNTKVNERDRVSSEMTADQQAHNSNDMSITRRIRQDVMKDGSFSTYAKNVKVISVNGKVTLKGPVRSEQEKEKISKYARAAAGAANVKNEMSVVAEKK